MEFFSDCFTKSKLSSEPSEEQNKFHRFKCIYLRTIEWYNRAVLQHALLGGELLHDVLHIDNYAKCIQHSSEGLVRGSKRKTQSHQPTTSQNLSLEVSLKHFDSCPRISRRVDRPLWHHAAHVWWVVWLLISDLHVCAFLRSQYLQQQK